MRGISGSCSPEAKKCGLFDDRREEFSHFAGGELRAALSLFFDKAGAAPPPRVKLSTSTYHQGKSSTRENSNTGTKIHTD